jgi:peptide/nickel transport system ATP-binding protein
MPSSEPILEIQNLWVSRVDGGEALLKGVSLALCPGEMLGIVGESGAGKTLFALALMGVLPETLRVSAGSAKFQGEELLRRPEAELQRLRGTQIAMILTGGRDALNPMETVGRQIRHVIQSHLTLEKEAQEQLVVDVLDSVGIPDAEERAKAYPHELSGGMAQRILIAQAIVCEPKLLIADEPTSDLDVTVAAQVLDGMKSVIDERGSASMLLTRDLGIVAENCDSVAVFGGGELLELGPVGAFFANPAHPASKALVSDALVALTHEGVERGTEAATRSVVSAEDGGYEEIAAGHYVKRFSHV